MYAYLRMISGAQAGTEFRLDPAATTTIGRGVDCNIVLTDPLCSRTHAMLLHEPDGWLIRDAGSRNSTYVNGQKIDEARLVDGTVVRIGSTDFRFELSATPLREPAAMSLTQTIVRDTPIDASDTGRIALAALGEPARAQDLLLLHQLAIRLLGCDEPDEVVQTALDLLRERARAAVVGFLWVTDDGRLRPKLVVPQDAARNVALSESLTERVCQQGRAIWIDNQMVSESSQSLRHFADAMCIPLVLEKSTLGAIHVYREQVRFEQSDFDFAISLANILAVALARARRQATLAARHQQLVHQAAAFDELVGESRPIVDLKTKIARLAPAGGCVLIRGESGVGKELVARALHRISPRADRPMLSVNCAAVPPTLLDSQLFGHKRGAFTGADSDHAGWFQQADSGTLFLDEVGEMTLEGQARLLRILEGHPFLPVGATKEVSVDVRILAATNRDLRDFVRERRFREDLFYRLSVFELYVPPLRERGDDVGLLLDFFLDHFKRQHGRPGLTLAAAAREKLLAYHWPGNVRQLRNVIDSAVVLAEGDAIEPKDLGLHDSGGGAHSLRLEDWERKLIAEALARTAGNVPEAARLLGIGRATLYRKIEEYGIER